MACDKLIRCEIIEAEHVEHHTRMGYMTRDFFINGRQYNWVMNVEIGDGAIARYGVLQGWPLHNGGKLRDRSDSASLDTGGLTSPLGHVAGGVVVSHGTQVERKPSLDTI